MRNSILVGLCLLSGIACTADTATQVEGEGEELVIGLYPICRCNGDVNRDGAVNYRDLAMAIDCRGSISRVCRTADIDCDGDVDLCDVDKVRCRFEGRANCCAMTCGSCRWSEGCESATRRICSDVGGWYTDAPMCRRWPAVGSPEAY